MTLILAIKLAIFACAICSGMCLILLFSVELCDMKKDIAESEAEDDRLSDADFTDKPQMGMFIPATEK